MKGATKVCHIITMAIVVTVFMGVGGLVKADNADTKLATPDMAVQVRLVGSDCKLPPSFTREGVYLELTHGEAIEGSRQSTTVRSQNPENKNPKSPPCRPAGNSKSQIVNRNSELISLTFLTTNKDTVIITEDLQDGKVNYFIGSVPEKWKANIPAYQSVVYKHTSQDIDVGTTFCCGEDIT